MILLRYRPWVWSFNSFQTALHRTTVGSFKWSSKAGAHVRPWMYLIETIIRQLTNQHSAVDIKSRTLSDGNNDAIAIHQQAWIVPLCLYKLHDHHTGSSGQRLVYVFLVTLMQRHEQNQRHLVVYNQTVSRFGQIPSIEAFFGTWTTGTGISTDWTSCMALSTLDGTLLCQFVTVVRGAITRGVRPLRRLNLFWFRKREQVGGDAHWGSLQMKGNSFNTELRILKI